MAQIPFPETFVEYDVLKEQGVTIDSIAPEGKKIALHYKVLAALHAEFEDIPSEEIPPETRSICRNIAMHFGLRLVGIDLLAEDIRKPLREQRAAFLELNTLPNIRMHTFKSNGTKENKVAEAIVKLALKYY